MNLSLAIEVVHFFTQTLPQVHSLLVPILLLFDGLHFSDVRIKFFNENVGAVLI